MSEEKTDQNLFLKKRLNVCRTSTGKLNQIPDNLVIDIIKSWERWQGTAKSFYQSLGIKKEQLGCIMKKGTLKALPKPMNRRQNLFTTLIPGDFTDRFTTCHHMNLEKNLTLECSAEWKLVHNFFSKNVQN